MGQKYTLDLCGEVCPVPVVKTKAMLEKMQTGDVLEVTVDYFPSKENVKRLAESEGCTVEIKEGEKTKIIIQK